MANEVGSLPIEFHKNAPPEWLHRTHKAADLGFPGFHPPRPGQEEDLLTVKYIKDGFSSTSTVAAETFSALGLAKEAIGDLSLLGQVEEIVSRVYARRNENAKELPQWSFKLPGRAAFNDIRRTNWIKELADPNIPLHKLGRSVPSGIRGHDLLDMLCNNNISMPRALWYIRILGGNETQQGMRKSNGNDHVQYSIEWTHTLTGYMKKLLTEITLPSPPRQGLNIRQSFKSPFTDKGDTEQWVKKCSYHLDLLNICFCEGLADPRTFLAWLAHQADPNVTNLAQFVLIARLAEEYVEGLATSRWFSRPFIHDCLKRLEELIANPHIIHMQSCLEALKRLLLKFMTINPESLISAEMWREYGSLIESIVLDSGNLCNGRPTVENALCDIKMRNNALLLRLPSTHCESAVKELSDELQVLNSLSLNLPPSRLRYFETNSNFKQKLTTLLTWSVCDTAAGYHRIYAAASLLSNLVNKAFEEIADVEGPITLHDELFDWLDRVHERSYIDNAREVARLFGELIRRQLFSYDRYVQRLISRCDQLEYSVPLGEGPAIKGLGTVSPHAEYLRNIPLIKADLALERQRKTALYGHRSRQTEEDRLEHAIQLELAKVLPYFYTDLDTYSPELSRANLIDNCPVLLNSSPFLQVRVWRGSIVHSVQKKIHRCPKPSPYGVYQYRVLFELLAMTRSYAVLFETLVKLFLVGDHESLLDVATELVIRFGDILVCMNGETTLSSVISVSVPRWKRKGFDLRSLLRLIDKMHLRDLLSKQACEAFVEYSTFMKQSLQPPVSNAPIIPAVVDSIQTLTNDSLLGSSRNLATRLWENYKASPEFSQIMWSNVFLLLQNVSDLSAPTLSHNTNTILEACAEFLGCVSFRSPNDFNKVISNWLTEMGANEWSLLPPHTFDLFTLLLRKLILRKILQSSTILSEFLFLIWKAAAGDLLNDSSFKLKSCTPLARLIFLCETEEPDELSLAEFQYLASQRTASLRGVTFQRFVDVLPSLVKIEYDERVDDGVRAAVSELRRQFTGSTSFKQAMLRELPEFQRAFFAALERDEIDSSVVSQIAQAGKYALQLTPDISRLPYGTDILDVKEMGEPFPLLYSFSRSIFEIQLTLLQFSGDQTHASPKELNDFVLSFFQLDSPGPDSILVDISSGAKGGLRTKFINHGLRRLDNLFEDCDLLSCTSEQLVTIVEQISRNLRVLCQFTEPWLETAGCFAISELELQKQLLSRYTPFLVLLFGLPSFGGCREPPQKLILSGESTRSLIVILMRLLHYLLAFLPCEPPVEVEAHLRSIRKLFLMKLLADTERVDFQLFVIMYDTVGYLTDAMSPDARTFDEFADFEIKPGNIAWLSADQRQQMDFLLGNFPVDHSYPRIGQLSDGDHISEAAEITKKPWEALDRTEVQPDPVDGADFKNIGSISLEHFAARLCQANSVFGLSDKIYCKHMMDETTVNSIFCRDWIEARVGHLRRPIATVAERPDMGDDIATVGIPNLNPRASPSPSVISLFSGSGSWKASPSSGASSKSVDLSTLSDSTSLPKRRQTRREEKASKRVRGSRSSRNC